MAPSTQVYEGTLSEITERYSSELSGLRLRVTIADESVSDNSPQKHFWETATPAEWGEALDAWAASHVQSRRPLSDEAVDRESIYEGRGE